MDKEKDRAVEDLVIQSSPLEVITTPRVKGTRDVDIGIKVEDSLPATPPLECKHDTLENVEIGKIGKTDDGLRSPETPARLVTFEINNDDTCSKQTIDDDDDEVIAIPPSTPTTPTTRQPRRSIPFPTSLSTPLTLPPVNLSTTNLPGAPRKSRSSSISSFLSSLKQSATKPFFPSWTSVGHRSGVPERLVVVSSIPHEEGQMQSKTEGNKMVVPGSNAAEGVGSGWTRDVKVEGGKGWKRSHGNDYGWSDDDQEEDWEQEVDDPREQLAEIANRTALVLEQGQDEDEGDRVGTGALGISWESDHRDGWKKFDGDDRGAPAGFVENEVGKGDLDKTLPIQAFDNLKLSSTPGSDELQQTGQLPFTAPPRKIIHYRHIIHLASNAMLEPRPERIVYHPLFERVIRVSGVDFNNAVMSVLMEVTQGRLGQEHYTLHDLYTWYKVTFRKKKVAEDTLQALLLALIQVSTGRPLGEREEATLQALQGNSMILCAVPLSYCLVHAEVYDSKTASALAEDLKGEVVGNQEMVSPELDQVSDASSDVDSGRDIPLTPPATPKRKMDKGKGRALDDDEDNDEHHTVGGLAPEDTPPRPSSALPISDTQYSVFPRIIGMVSKKLQVTTELALFQPEVERALTFAGITCEQFQEVMFKAQELDQDEMSKRWEEREFVCPDGRWQASRYFEAISIVSPFAAAVHVRQLPAFQRALIYLMMMCFDWPEDQPEDFIIRLENEHRLIIDHSPYKPSKFINKPVEHKGKPSETTFFESPEQWLEITRVHQLQIGPSTKVWQPTASGHSR